MLKKKLLKLQFTRLKRQKLFYLYFAVMAVIILSNAFRCMKGNGMEYYAEGRFLTFCMQSYIDIIGPLFLSFICAVLISGEKANGMLRQPLLNGVSKMQLLITKTISILMTMLICFLFVILFSAGVGLAFWGTRIFDYIQECTLQALLLTIPQITMTLFLTFLSFHVPNIPSMMCASLIFLLLNNLFSQFFKDHILYVDFAYYLYAFSEYNGNLLTADTIIIGLIVNVITVIILIFVITRKDGIK